MLRKEVKKIYRKGSRKSGNINAGLNLAYEEPSRLEYLAEKATFSTHPALSP